MGLMWIITIVHGLTQNPYVRYVNDFIINLQGNNNDR